MFRFAHSEYLYALYLIPALVFLFWYLYRKQKKLLESFTDKSLVTLLAPHRSRAKYITKTSIITFALILLILAYANPQVGTRYEDVKQAGIDVFILLDVSLSMKAEDILPNRLEKARHSISSLIQRLKGDRIGLIVFSGASYIQFPLTTDYAAANLLLSAVSFNSVPQPGTAISEAINSAVRSFKSDVSTQKVIVVITDGEDHEGDVSDAVKNAAEKGISVYAIGLGSSAGAPIPVGAGGNTNNYKTDSQGNIVLTRLDETVLRQIASEGNGKYYRGSSNENELEAIYNDLSKLEKTEYGVARVTAYEDRFYYLLAPAIILLILEFFLTERKSPLFSGIFRKLGIEKINRSEK